MSKSTLINWRRYSTEGLNKLSEETAKLRWLIQNPCNEIYLNAPEKDIFSQKYALEKAYYQGIISLKTLRDEIPMMTDWSEIDVPPIPREWDDCTFESDFVWESM
jgi:hypothetical protein